MPLNDADRAWIRQEIQSIYKRQGLGRLTGFIKDWSGAGAAVGILLFLATQWTGYIEFRTTTNIRLGNIEDSLKQIRRALSPLQIGAQASLPTESFRAALPELKSALTTAKEEQLPVSPKVMIELQEKLLETNQEAVDFWPTAAEFISYRSQTTTPDFQGLLRPTLPNCTDRDPTPMQIATVSKDRHKATITSAYYDNCRLTLDSVQDDAKINAILESTAPILTFRHCVIIYRGGEINLILAFQNRPSKIFPLGHPEEAMETQFTGQTLFFENCLFDIELVGQPPLPGRQFAQSVLATNGTEIKFSVSTSSTHS